MDTTQVMVEAETGKVEEATEKQPVGAMVKQEQGAFNHSAMDSGASANAPWTVVGERAQFKPEHVDAVLDEGEGSIDAGVGNDEGKEDKGAQDNDEGKEDKGAQGTIQDKGAQGTTQDQGAQGTSQD